MPSEDPWGLRFGIGVLGGAAPEIFRWYGIVTTPEALPSLNVSPTVYFAVTGIFLLVAGAIPLIWQEQNRFKCFYLGITAPATLSLLGGAAPMLG